MMTCHVSDLIDALSTRQRLLWFKICNANNLPEGIVVAVV